MKHFGVAVDLPKSVRKLYLTYSGIDLKRGKRCTGHIHEKYLDIPGLEGVVLHMEAEKGRDKDAEEARLVGIVAKTMADGKDKREVNKLLAKKNISMIVSKGKDGTVKDVTYIDHAKHTVFSGNLKGLPVSSVEKVRKEVWEAGKPITPQRKTSILKELLEDALEIAAMGRNRKNEDRLEDALEIAAMGRNRKNEDRRYGPHKKPIGPQRR